MRRLVPFAPTPPSAAEKALEMAKIREGDIFCDLGCGMGTLILEAARRGAFAVGIEINPSLAKKARRMLKKTGFFASADVIIGDLFFPPIRASDVIYLFLDSEAVRSIRKPLLMISRKGTRIVSLAFNIPGMTPTREELALADYPEGLEDLYGHDSQLLRTITLYLYVIE